MLDLVVDLVVEGRACGYDGARAVAGQQQRPKEPLRHGVAEFVCLVDDQWTEQRREHGHRGGYRGQPTATAGASGAAAGGAAATTATTQLHTRVPDQGIDRTQHVTRLLGHAFGFRLLLANAA